jgi:hypothetical protein
MKYEFFQSLTREEAQQYLERFLTCEREGLMVLRPEAESEGISMDFSLGSVPPLWRWILTRVKTIQGPMDESLPSWIKESVKATDLVEFEEESKPLVMRAAYYLGEAFVRHSGRLSWGTGNADYMECNMPVVAGFRKGLQLPPITVTENVFLNILAEGDSPRVIEKMIDHWRSLIPKADERKAQRTR